MRLPQQVRARFSADDVPAQCYAVVGAGLQARRVAGRGMASLTGKMRAVERDVPRAQQLLQQTQLRAGNLPGDALAAVGAGWAWLTAAPGAVAATTSDAVIDLREATARQYTAWSRDGERAVAQWHAQRVLNQRADRMTRSVTPFAARATVSARDAARTAASSPTAARLREVRRHAGKAWQDYQAAVADSGGGGWGEAAVNGVPAASPATATSRQR